MSFTTRCILLFFSFLFCVRLAGQAKEQGDLMYVANYGQWAKQVLYKAEIQDGSVYLMKDRFRYDFHSAEDIAAMHGRHDENGNPLRGHAYDVIFKNSNPLLVDGSFKAARYNNYFIGSDSTKWATGVPLFQQVHYQRLYTEIDMQVYSTGTSLKYDLLVHPGGDASDIQLEFEGVQPFVRENGDLVINTSVNMVIEMAPYAYQVIDGSEIVVPCRYIVHSGKLSFEFPSGYNQSYALVIDPALKFATYTGSTGQMNGYCVTFDQEGNIYAAVDAWAAGFPTTVGAYQRTYIFKDLAINKYDSTGSKLLFSTYLGGSFQENPTNMIVNKYNELIVTGRTYSSDFPITSGAVGKSYGGNSDIFVSVFSHTGNNLLASTYIGGADEDGHSYFAFQAQDGDKSGLTVDDNGYIYVATTTKSKDFPVTTSAYQSTPGSAYDGCVFKLNRNCSALLFSTFLAGDYQDCIYDCKLLRNGNIVVCGMSLSTNFPLTTNAYADTGNAFVSIISNNGKFLLASSRLGLHSASAVKVSIDDYENVFVCGNNDTGFVVSPNAYAHPNGKIFIAKMSPGLDSVLLSTKLINVPAPGITGFANVCGDIVVSTYLNKTNSNLPVTNASYQSAQGMYYFLHLSSSMDSLLYSTYFGVNDPACHSHGTANVIDTNGVIWVSSCISIVKDSLLGTSGSYCSKSLSTSLTSDFLTAKFDMEVLPAKPLAKAVIPDTVCTKADVYFYNQSKNAYSYIWHFGDGDTSHSKYPVHAYDTPGYYKVKLEAYNPYSCRLVDSLVKTVFVDTNEIFSSFASVDTACIGNTVHFYNTSRNGISNIWHYGDGAGSSTFNGQHVYTAAGQYNVMLVSFNPDYCNKTDTFYRLIIIDTSGPGADFSVADSVACADKPLQFTNATPRGLSYNWNFGDGSSSSTINPIHVFTTGGKHTIRLVATNNNLCRPVDTTYRTVTILPPPQFDLADSFICGGKEPVQWGIKLTHINSNPSYKWGPVNAIISGGSLPTAIVDPRVATKYYVTVSDTIPGLCGHQRSDTAVLTIVDYPDSVDATSNSPICEGDALLLKSTTATNIPFLKFSWSGPGSFAATGQNVGRENISINQGGKYRIAVDNQGCITYADAAVIVKPKPKIEAYSNSPVWTGKELVLKFNVDKPLDSFFWTGPLGFYSMEQNPVLKPVVHEMAGSYTLRAWHDGCLSGSITVVQVSEVDSHYLRIYPNPGNGQFYLEGKGYHEQEIKMLVVNSVGQKLYRADINTEKKHFKHKVVLPPVANGVYIIWVLMDGEYKGLPFTVLSD